MKETVSGLKFSTSFTLVNYSALFFYFSAAFLPRLLHFQFTSQIIHAVNELHFNYSESMFFSFNVHSHGRHAVPVRPVCSHLSNRDLHRHIKNVRMNSKLSFIFCRVASPIVTKLDGGTVLFLSSWLDKDNRT